ncbi:hypothetical protein, partial [Streptomyces caniscabiei]|uniref:hypothetical protein n=1 Tax=Streptomyces caniscabiei TaxID=2746961 RepID=UPI001C4EA4FA
MSAAPVRIRMDAAEFVGRVALGISRGRRQALDARPGPWCDKRRTAEVGRTPRRTGMPGRPPHL